MLYYERDYLIKYIGTTVEYERISRHLSIQQLADVLGLSPQMIKSIEGGTRGTTIDNLVKICDFFNISLDYLVGRDVDSVVFRSPNYLDNKNVELQALCSTLNDEQTELVLSFVKNLITYTRELKAANKPK